MLKIKEFWKKYELKIVLIVGFILVAVISFEGGVLKGQKVPKNPIIIEKPAETPNQDNPSGQDASGAQNLPQNNANTPSGISKPAQNCAFVASKNSTIYHLPTCSYAKRIKPENLTCFSSADEAKSKGYLPDKNCIK